MALYRKIIITCDVLVELPMQVEDHESFAALEEQSLQHGITAIQSAFQAGQEAGYATSIKFKVQKPRMSVHSISREKE